MNAVIVDKLPFRSTFHKYRKILRAVLSRLILGGHAGFGVWWVASKVNGDYYGLLIATVILFVLETGAILYYRAGCEFKRFCTPFAVYLTCLVPALWVLKDQEAKGSGGRSNATNTGSDVINNTRVYDPTNIAAIVGDKKDGISRLLGDESITSLLEQSMMILIILCRWLLPRGRIDRSSLSQLLIMYSAIGADILDFSEIFDRVNIASNGKDNFRFVVLGVWAWSLVQFTLVVTTSFQFRLRRRNQNSNSKSKSNSTDQSADSGGQDKSEALSILMVFFMQDGPFLVSRCYAIFVLKLPDYQIMFFSLKNALTLILGLYRLLVLCGCVTKEGNDLLTMEEVAKSMESLDTIMTEKPRTKRGGKGQKK